MLTLSEKHRSSREKMSFNFDKFVDEYQFSNEDYKLIMELCCDENVDNNPIKAGKIDRDRAKILALVMVGRLSSQDDPIKKEGLREMVFRALKHVTEMDGDGMYYDITQKKFFFSEPGKPDTSRYISISTIIDHNRIGKNGSSFFYLDT